MSNPDGPGDDNLNEWVEVFNPGTEPINLQGWRIGDALNTDVLGALVVESGGFAVIAAAETQLPQGVPVLRVTDGRIGNGLNNGGDAVVLIAPSGELADAISYGENTEFEAGTATVPGSGETIGRDMEFGGWELTLEPSPGAANRFPPRDDAVEPDRTATNASPTARATKTAEPGGVVASGAGEQPVTIAERPPGDSPVPWIILGAAASVGAAGLYSMGSRYAKAALERRRGR